MRYQLRSLLIVLALGPPLLAAGWWGYAKWREARELSAMFEELERTGATKGGRP
jgi:hypothetical protein